MFTSRAKRAKRDRDIEIAAARLVAGYFGGDDTADDLDDPLCRAAVSLMLSCERTFLAIDRVSLAIPDRPTAVCDVVRLYLDIVGEDPATHNMLML